MSQRSSALSRRNRILVNVLHLLVTSRNALCAACAAMSLVHLTRALLPAYLRLTSEAMGTLQGLSPECTDLLYRLLEVDPDKRITVQQVLKHPWTIQDMPEGMANLNSNLLQVPLSIQSGNCTQSEEEIVQLTNTAVQGAKARQRLSFNHSGLTNSGLE